MNETKRVERIHLPNAATPVRSPAYAYLMVCRQVQDTVHHIFSS